MRVKVKLPKRTKADKTAQAWWHRRIKLLSALGVLILLGGIVYAVVKNMNAPAIGSLNQTPPAKQEVVDPYKEPGSYSGKYISYTYPAHYKKVAIKDQQDYFDRADYLSTDRSNKQISISVSKDTLDNNSGVSFRKAHPELYTQSRTRFGLTFVSTAKATSSDTTAFVQHNELLASISLSAPAGTDLAADMSTLLNSLQWK
jgi:hypothetical protein